jgi:16S rRNA (cytidine1402-2'-O)-methyltransferase
MQRQKTFLSDAPKLFLVGVPIGNYDDITYRAIQTLKEADVIYCEDTRNTGLLLSHYDISTPLKSYHMFNENEITEQLVGRVKSGEKIAVVSDAGMPSISDPGFLAAREAIKEQVDVVVVPGVSAGITALVGSGMTTQNFAFYGFLNSNKTRRREELLDLRDKTETLIIYEAVHRIRETLELMLEVLGDRNIAIARELTKKYEEYLRGKISEALKIVDDLKGEMVLIIEGSKISHLTEQLNSKTIREHYDYYVNQGFERQEALKKVARDRDVAKSIIYQAIFGKDEKENV